MSATETTSNSRGFNKDLTIVEKYQQNKNKSVAIRPYFDENVSHSMSSSEYMLVIIILEQDDNDIHHTDSFTQPKRDHQHQTIKEGK